MTYLSTEKVKISRVSNSEHVEVLDVLAVEEPMEIVIAYGDLQKRQKRTVSITMRTPTNNDFDLAIGFLFGEGIISSISDVVSVRYVGSEFKNSVEESANVVQVDLYANVKFDWDKINRHFYMSSSCGVCGKTSIDMVNSVVSFCLDLDTPLIHKSLLYPMLEKLGSLQSIFKLTGGIHGSALFDINGELVIFREDIGRHNALDKVIGWAIQNKKLPLRNEILFLSGRVSFELVQKAVLAGISIIVAVGAPSSIAVELASECGVTLVGFLKQNKFNIYTNPGRIVIV